ncbi:MAG: diaminopimelate epimerase [bacterium]|nr:diaminopimelate epimerase [bacterium]
MKLAFTKMHGAGNDFVMVDGRLPSASSLDTARIAALCDRRRGIGADGLILVAPTPDADFRMTYFNADGGEADMCGNGARCAVEYAAHCGLHEGACRLATGAGVIGGRRHGPGDVEVSLPPWRDLALALELESSPWDEHHVCNTGVPHLVIPVPDVELVPVREWGHRLRHDPIFAPAGVNVNWVAAAPGGEEYLLRTYERGVEDETLACGTGASATAVVLSHLERATSPVRLRTRGGDLLVVDVDRGNGSLTLRGPAVVSFEGEVQIDE